MSDWSRSPKVLFVGAFPPRGNEAIGGVASSCLALVNSPLSRRVQFVFVDSTQAGNPPPPLHVRACRAFVRYLEFLWKLLRHRPDAVLLFASAGASLVEKTAMGWASRAFGAPVLLFPRAGRVIDQADGSGLYRAFLRVAMRCATVLLCQSQRWHDFAISTLGFDHSRAVVIENWTASEDLLQVGRSRGAHAPCVPVRITYVGWLEREKGVLDLVSACGQLRADAHDFELVLVGDGHAMADVQAACREHGIADRTRLLGWQSPAGVREALRDSDIFVLPSWAEGLPNAMIEAMAARLPVVVSAVGGIPDVIESGRTGLIVPPRDRGALAQALADLINDPALASRLAGAAHDMAARRFSVDAAVERFLVAIDVAVNGRAPR